MTSKSHRSDAGFSFIELLISMGIVLLIVGAVTDGLLQTTTTTRMTWNRTEMHSGVRGVTKVVKVFEYITDDEVKQYQSSQGSQG